MPHSDLVAISAEKAAELSKFAALVGGDGWVGAPAFDAVADLMADALFFKDVDGRYVLANAAARAILTGDSATDIRGLTDLDLLPDEQGRALRATDLRVIESRTPMVAEERVAIGQGEQWFLSAKVPVTGADGMIIGVLGSASNITARKRADAALRASEARFRAIADNIPHLAWITDAGGQITWYNKRWLDYTGRSLAEMTQDGWQSVHHPDHLDRVTEGWATSLQGGTPWEDIFPLRGRDGEYRWFLSRAAPIHDEATRVSMWFGTNTDVTDQREHEARLRAAKALSERQQATKSKFLAAISHDLRQPLQSLVFSATASAEYVRPEGQATFRKLEGAITALATLLDNLFDVARLESELILPHPSEFDVSALLERIASAYRPMAALRDVTIHVVSFPIMVRSDPELLFRILSHLVENAARYTEHGRILLDCVARENMVELEVRDSGVGIAEQHLDLIWDEFFQVGNARRERQEGQGLGLSIVRRLASLLGHRVTVKSEIGQGTAFTIELPRVAEVAVPALAAPTLLTTTPGLILPAPRIARRPRIVVVDDDLMLRESFESIFELWAEPWETVLAESADAVFEAVPVEACPDFLVMDFRLGEETGDQATKRIRAHYGQNIPAIMLTGDVGEEVQEAARRVGMPLLYKPINTQALHDLICRHLVHIG